MSCVAKLDLDIVQGATFTKGVHWYGGGKVCKMIGNVTPGCPTLITLVAHGLPSISNTPVFISHVKGATRVNTEDNQPVIATYVDVDSFYVDSDTVAQDYTTGTGLLTYFAPKDLTDWIARMHIREERDDTTTIVELASPDDIDISAADALITINITDEATTLYDFDEGVYDLELEDAAGDVTRLIEGSVTLCREVTR
jgi:hypothetical protein